MEKVKTTIAKQRIKAVFNDSLENVRNGKTADVSGNMRKHGYSKSSARALKVKQTKTWQGLLAQVDDELLLNKLYQIATDIKDKRACMEAIKEIYKLKDKYPANKYKAEGFDNELQGLFFNIGKDQEKGERG